MSEPSRPSPPRSGAKGSPLAPGRTGCARWLRPSPRSSPPAPAAAWPCSSAETASGDELLRGWIEEDQVREIELELRAVAGAEVEIGLEAGRELVASDVQDDQGVWAGRLEDHDLPFDYPALRAVAGAVAGGPGAPPDGLRPRAPR